MSDVIVIATFTARPGMADAVEAGSPRAGRPDPRRRRLPAVCTARGGPDDLTFVFVERWGSAGGAGRPRRTALGHRTVGARRRCWTGPPRVETFRAVPGGDPDKGLSLAAPAPPAATPRPPRPRPPIRQRPGNVLLQRAVLVAELARAHVVASRLGVHELCVERANSASRRLIFVSSWRTRRPAPPLALRAAPPAPGGVGRPSAARPAVGALRPALPRAGRAGTGAGLQQVRPAPVAGHQVPSSMASVRVATASISARSWETSTIVPA